MASALGVSNSTGAIMGGNGLVDGGVAVGVAGLLLGLGGKGFCVVVETVACGIGATNCTLRRAMSEVVGFGIAAEGRNGEITGAGGRATGGNGAPATGTSMVVACGTVACGTVAWGTKIVDEYGTGLFV